MMLRGIVIFVGIIFVLSGCLARQTPITTANNASPTSPETSMSREDGRMQSSSCNPVPSADPPLAEWKHELIITPIDDGKWGCSLENAGQVMRSAAGELWKYFPDRKMPLIEVVSKGGPVFNYNIGDDRHVRVLLNTGDNHWAQMAYQFAHEFCHLLCNFNDQSAQMWFQETLCEMASRFALSRMSETWKTSPPDPNWKGYAGALQSYLDNLQKNDRLPEGKTLAQWYLENSEALQKNSIDRSRNNVVAAELWKMLDDQPEHWEAVTYYPREKLNPNTFDEFLRVWQRDCPGKHKAFIAAIARKFEITLPPNGASIKEEVPSGTK